MSLNDWIKVQEQRGITTFSFQQIRCVFTERSEKTLKTDINRLTLSKRIQNVYKGFYVIIPTQYQLKGVVPPTYYINELMEYLGKPYYVGLLSAAAIYGASHQSRLPSTPTFPLLPSIRNSRIGKFPAPSQASDGASTLTRFTSGLKRTARIPFL